MTNIHPDPITHSYFPIIGNIYRYFFPPAPKRRSRGRAGNHWKIRPSRHFQSVSTGESAASLSNGDRGRPRHGFFSPTSRPSATVRLCSVIFFLLAGLHVSASAAVLHVWTNSSSPAAPYDAWSNAAHTIQEAIDIASTGDVVWVTNGLYDAGGRVIAASMTNRIAISNAVIVRSVNGPSNTFIVGRGTTGNTAVRCAYVGTDCILDGFTLTNGHTRTGGTTTTEQSGGGIWCASGALVTNCIIRNCKANYYGGGGYGGTYRQCDISDNWSGNSGGGIYNGSLYECKLLRNESGSYGGGLYSGRAEDSVLAFNIATNAGGGGASGAHLERCVIRENRSGSSHGGGLRGGSCANSLVVGNHTLSSGGGLYQSAATNCAILANIADYGGGCYDSDYLVNCVIYHNRAVISGDNYAYGSYSYCCITPNPGGTGNFTNDPGTAGLYNGHLVAASVCRDAGYSADAAGTLDIDGEDRIVGLSVDIGCDEFHAANITGLVTTAIGAETTHTVIERPIRFEADIEGKVNAFLWSWGDSSSESNRVIVSHAYTNPGVYDVVLSAWNNDGSVSITQTVIVVAGFTNYVSLTGAHIAPFTNWTDAATNIQDAINANDIAGGEVRVGEGMYATGYTNDPYGMRARVVVDRPVRVMAENPDPALTVIQGASVTRCVYLANGASLSGFTLSNGHTRAIGDYTLERSAGGAYCESGAILSNCILRNNYSIYDAAGVLGGTLIDCFLYDNVAGNNGGGAQGSRLIHCTISGNLATNSGGGICEAHAMECVISNNTARNLGGGMYGGSASNCWLTDNQNTGSSGDGGGSYQGRLVNCALIGNAATDEGGGAKGSELVNCTIAGNRAVYGGGVCDVDAYNCVVYYNEASQDGPNFKGDTYLDLQYCCSDPLATGPGNLTNAPAFLALRNPRLSSTSPCLNTGDDTLTDGSTDLGGDPRIHGTHVDIGCYEYDAARLTGVVISAFALSATNVASGFPVNFESRIEGRAGNYTWNWGALLTNHPLPQYSFPSAGVYDVVLTAWNNDATASSTARITVVAGFTNYVSLTGTHTTPFTNWSTAATNIQAAIDANNVAGGFVLIDAGLYSNGFYALNDVTSRIGIAKSITVMGTNRDTTIIVGGGATTGTRAVRCAYVGNGATLANVTLNGGYTRADGDTLTAQSGGGAWCEASGIVSNCLVTDCMANYYGGGVYGGRVRNSRLTLNLAVGSSSRGGGAYGSVVQDSEIFTNCAVYAGGGLYGGFASGCQIMSNYCYRGGGTGYGSVSNCLIAANSAVQGGGNYNGNLVACTISNNVAAGGGGVYGSTVSNCVIANNRARTGNGGGAYDSLLRNSTLARNESADDGGGAFRGTLLDCTVAFNGCTNSDALGGGIAGDTFEVLATNCTIKDNTAAYGGGGIAYALVSGCSIVSNWANRYGGGAYNSGGDNNMVAFNEAGSGGGASGSSYYWYHTTFWNNTATDRNGGVSAGTYYNCIVYSNNAPTNANWYNVSMYNCCTIPGTGLSAVTNNPLLLSEFNGHLLVPSSNSPCIDAGRVTAYARDCIGIPRPLDGDNDGFNEFDIGPYEYVNGLSDSDRDLLGDYDELFSVGTDPLNNDTDGDTMYDGWEHGYNLNPLDATDGQPDSDGDAFINRDEFTADTNPTNINDFFRVAGATFAPSSTVRFVSSSNRQYTLQINTNLPHGAWIDLPDQTDVPGFGGWQSLVDTNTASPRFNRLQVSVP